jgi:hypothetical protein
MVRFGLGKMTRRLLTGSVLLATVQLPCVSAQTSANSPATASQEQDAHPPVTKMDLRIAKRATSLLRAESDWDRSDKPHIDGDKSTACQPSARQMSLYCALERATVEVTGHFEHRGAVMQEARFVIEEMEPNWESKYQHLLVDYNNDPHTTFQGIQKALRSVEQRIASRIDKDRRRGS